MTSTSERFAETLRMYYGHVAARIPEVKHPDAEKKPTQAQNSRHANAKKAVDTRKAKYGDSKMKRGTRESARKSGAKVKGD